MQTYDFEMTLDGVIVAFGTCSSVMLYEFQKAFFESIGPGHVVEIGHFYSLDLILSAMVLTTDCWRIKSVDGKRFAFWYQRIN